MSIFHFIWLYFYKIIILLRIDNPTLIKIYVPKYNYTVLCPCTLDDYFNLTIREVDIIEHFCPKK
jgi:hypothetical protein